MLRKKCVSHVLSDQYAVATQAHDATLRRIQCLPDLPLRMKIYILVSVLWQVLKCRAPSLIVLRFSCVPGKPPTNHLSCDDNYARAMSSRFDVVSSGGGGAAHVYDNDG
jgi:hypothetical protein